jgi:hypothetical protein
MKGHLGNSLLKLLLIVLSVLLVPFIILRNDLIVLLLHIFYLFLLELHLLFVKRQLSTIFKLLLHEFISHIRILLSQLFDFIV